MTITVESFQQIDIRTWRLRVTSDEASPVFRFYRDMQLVSTQTGGSRDFDIEPGTAPVLEVRDDADGPTEVFPEFATLIWYAPGSADSPTLGVDYYLIERSEAGGAYESIHREQHVVGTRKYRYRTPRLKDVTEYSFRITPIGLNANNGTARTLGPFLSVRHPDPPNLNVSVNADRTLTLSKP